MSTINQPVQAGEHGEELVVRDLGIRTVGVEIATGVSLTVGAGEAVAIVGESGSGKSLTARALIDLLPDGVTADGELHLGERDLTALGDRGRRELRGSGMALVMQDPFTMLNPVERCGDQIVQPLGLARGGRRAEAVQRLAEVGIDDPAVADKYPFELSGGMRQRVGIACAIAERPRLLIADEPTTALDVTTQREILELLGELRRSHRMGLVLITHDLRVAFSVCDRVHVMYAGALVEVAPAPAMARRPRHPYTLGLLLADPPLERRVERLPGIPGSVPSPGQRPPGCPFAPRCEWAQPACERGLPELADDGGGHATRCRRIDEIAPELTRRRGVGRAAVRSAAEVPPGETLVVVEDVRKVFPSRRRRQQGSVALDGVSIELRAGESVGLVGESGSGKTTLGRMVVGLEQPTTGLVRVADVVLPPRGSVERGVLRATVQMAFQDPYSSLNPARTIRATLLEATSLSGERRPVDELLELVGLPAHYADRRPAALSGGERQRVAIARALARNPRLVVCDEVVSALDVSVQAQILTLLRTLRDELGLAYLFITHDLAVVRQITDRVYVLRRGQVVEQGATERVLEHPEHPYTQRLIASIPRGTA